MLILDGKKVSQDIKSDFENRIESLKQKPYVAILGIEGDEASKVYVNRIQKNCDKYNIKCEIMLSKNEEEFISDFNSVKDKEEITGIMFQQPLPKKCLELINEMSPEKDIEGLSYWNMGKLFFGDDCLIPCTSEAVIKTIEYYDIDLTGKKVTIVGRSNIVGKPLIPQLLAKNATVTVCHSRTKEIDKVLQDSDVIVMAIGKAKFLKKDMIKEGAILIDVGINCVEGKIYGDIDFEEIQEKASMCTPVPGGIGVVTNALLINNIIKSVELKNKSN